MSISALSVCALWPSQYARYEALDSSVNQGYPPPLHTFDLPTPLDLLDPFHLFDLPTPLDLLDPLHPFDRPTPLDLLHPLHLLDLFDLLDLPPIAPSLPSYPTLDISGAILGIVSYFL